MTNQLNQLLFNKTALSDRELNRRMRFLDGRLGALEDLGFTFQENESELVAAALARINEAILPVIEQIQDFAYLGDLLTATSASSLAIGLGMKTFIVDVDDRDTFAAPLFVIASVDGSPNKWMAGTTQSWSRETGALMVDITNMRDAGTYADWIISVASIPPEAPPAQAAEDITLSGVAGISATNVKTALAEHQGDIDGLTSSLAAKAPLASPALTGTPTAPTASGGTSTTQVATTAFVAAAIAALVGSAPASLDTLNEIASALANDANLASTLTTAIALKANAASPTFTGTIDATGAVLNAATQTQGDSSTKAATTAYALGVRDSAETTLASATTTNLGSITTTDKILITGTTTITGFGTVAAGTVKKIRFSGALTLTHHSTSLVLPGGANISVAAGDNGEAVSLGSGNWVVRAYQRANGQPIVSGGDFAGYTTSSDVSLTDFPIGSMVLVGGNEGTVINRNQSNAVYRGNSSGAEFSVNASSSTILAGTWRARGRALRSYTQGDTENPAVSMPCYLMQRVA